MYEIDKKHPLNDVSKASAIAQSYVNKVKSSKDRDIGFELGLLEYTEILSAPVCNYTGQPFDFDDRRKQPSLERINPLDGYTSTNTVLVTNEVNSAKSNLDTFLHSDKLTMEQKLRIMNRVIYRLKKQLKAQAELGKAPIEFKKNESLVSD